METPPDGPGFRKKGHLKGPEDGPTPAWDPPRGSGTSHFDPRVGGLWKYTGGGAPPAGWGDRRRGDGAAATTTSFSAKNRDPPRSAPRGRSSTGVLPRPWVAEGVGRQGAAGFEPAWGVNPPAFEAGAFVHSATHPLPPNPPQGFSIVPPKKEGVGLRGGFHPPQ